MMRLTYDHSARFHILCHTASIHSHLYEFKASKSCYWISQSPITMFWRNLTLCCRKHHFALSQPHPVCCNFTLFCRNFNFVCRNRTLPGLVQIASLHYMWRRSNGAQSLSDVYSSPSISRCDKKPHYLLELKLFLSALTERRVIGSQVLGACSQTLLNLRLFACREALVRLRHCDIFLLVLWLGLRYYSLPLICLAA